MKKQRNVIDLFSGVGGLSLGAARAGFNVLGAVEIDAHAIAAHETNFPSSRHLRMDLARVNGKQLLTSLGISKKNVSGIIGGPPCQGFSSIGHRNVSDPRNQLFVQFFKIVRDVQPAFFLAENVPGIMDDANKKLREKAFSYVHNDYELLPAQEFAADDFGAPTTRTRYMFIGYKRGWFAQGEFVVPKSRSRVLVRNALHGLPKRISPNWQTDAQAWRKVRYEGDTSAFCLNLRGRIPKGVGDKKATGLLRSESLVSGFLGTKHSEVVIQRFAATRQGESDRVSKCKRLKLDGYCPTLRAGTGSDRGSFQAVRPLHPTANRVIVPREAARLQGFPDWFQFSPTKWHSFRQIGNSVSPLLAEKVLRRIHQSLLS